MRDPWAVGAAARAAGARAPETRSVDRRPSADRAAADVAAQAAARRRRARRAPVGGRPAARRRRSCSAASTGCPARRWRSATAGGPSCSASPSSCIAAPGFQWTGNVTPPRLPDAELAELDGQLRAVCAEVAARFGVRGAFGVDAIWDGRHAWVLEVNPRPPAGLELFGPGSFEAHVRGARGLGLPTAGTPPATRCARVKLVLFAERDLRAPDPGWWPAGLVRDIPHAGETISRGRAGVHAGLGRRRRAGARRARRASAGRAPRGGARPWLSSAPGHLRGLWPAVRRRDRRALRRRRAPAAALRAGRRVVLGARSARGRRTGRRPSAVEPADVETALARAAELLRGARRPLLHGFDGATVEDARAAVALADRLGALVATGGVDGAWPGAPAVPLRGASTATLGEIRDRSQLVVIWREDPETHPSAAARPPRLRRPVRASTPSARWSSSTTATPPPRARADLRLRWPARARPRGADRPARAAAGAARCAPGDLAAELDGPAGARRSPCPTSRSCTDPA